ncbi:hypothetical protein ACTFIY_006820 [Dictyostelium cf. discoideum]
MSLINNNFFIPEKLFFEKDDFIYLTKGGVVPQSFEKVALSSESPNLSEINFHKNVKIIYFLDGYSHYIKKELFPSSVIGAIFFNITYALTSESVPNSIKFMGFNGYKNQITKEIVKPFVSYLGVGGDMGFPLKKELLGKDSIKSLMFDGNYSHQITNESIIDNLYSLCIIRTKFSLDENSLRPPMKIYPPISPKGIFFCDGYKFNVTSKLFPPLGFSILKNDINIQNISNPITKELFKDLPTDYRVNIGWGYKHKLTAGMIDNYERSVGIGNIVHPVPDIFFGEKVRFFNGYSHKISPFSYGLQVREMVFGQVKFAVTKDIMPSMNIQDLYFEIGYDHKLTPDIFCNVKCLTLDGIKSNVFNKTSLPKSNCSIRELTLKNSDFPFDSSFFPTDGIHKLILCNITQVIGNDQLPKSLFSLSLIKVKLDPKIRIPESLSHLKIEDIDQQLTKETIPSELDYFELLVYKFPLSKDLFPNSIKHILIGETINPFTPDMVPESLKLLMTAHDYKFLPLDKPLLKYYCQ